jgi:hypothetical protein
MAQAFYLYIDSLGREHPHRDRVFVQRSARASLLAHRHSGAALSASAFAAGPALLILLCLFVRKVSNFDPGREQIQSLAKTVAYAICINVFFFLCEVFVAFYSNIPGHMHAIKYLFVGLDGHGAWFPGCGVPWC